MAGYAVANKQELRLNVTPADPINTSFSAGYSFYISLLRSLVSPGRESLLNAVQLSASHDSALLHFLQRHDLLPLFACQARAAGIEQQVPESIMSPASDAFTRTWVTNEQKFAAWRLLGEAFNKAGIELLALKGLWFSQELYSDHACRPMSDIDIMIRAKDVPEIYQIMNTLGYESHRLNAPGRKELWFNHRKLPIRVDAHLTLNPAYSHFSVPVETMWERSIPVDVHGVKARVFAPEDQLLHFAIHGAVEHLYLPLRLLIDLYFALVRWNSTINWPALRYAAEKAGLNSALGTSIRMVEEIFKYQVNPVPQLPADPPVDVSRWLVEDSLSLSQRQLSRLVAVQPLMSGLGDGRSRHAHQKEPHKRARNTKPGSQYNSPVKWLGRYLRLLWLGVASLSGFIMLLSSGPEKRAVVLRYVRIMRYFHKQA